MQKPLNGRTTEFLDALRREWQVDDLDSLPPVAEEPSAELTRVPVDDPTALTDSEIEAIRAGFMSRFGMVALECRRTTSPDATHPLARLGEQLATHIPARWPVTNLSDGPDGTTKIHDAGTPQESRSLTSLGMAAHQDGWLSLRGVLSVTGLWTDVAPASAAATYGVNIVRLALDLRTTDPEAFASLFADDAVVIRRLSDGAVVATSPVLYARNDWTYSFFREPNDEFEVCSGSDDPAGRRAVEFLAAHSRFRAGGSTYTYLDRPGRGLLFNNRHCIHGRTAFTDDTAAGRKRVIASKWWICDPEHRSLVWD